MENWITVETNVGDIEGEFCPACGSPIYAEDDPDRCKHVMFTHINEADGFDYVNPKYQSVVDEVMNDDAHDFVWDQLEAGINKLARSDRMFLTIKEKAIGHGIMWTTITFGIDFAPE